MKEKTLLKIALIISMVGIVILFFTSQKIGVTEKDIGKINADNTGEIVKIKGNLNKITRTEKAVFLEITQPAEIIVIILEGKNISLAEGQTIEVIGKIDEYNGKMEVIAERIRVIN